MAEECRALAVLLRVQLPAPEGQLTTWNPSFFFSSLQATGTYVVHRHADKLSNTQKKLNKSFKKQVTIQEHVLGWVWKKWMNEGINKHTLPSASVTAMTYCGPGTAPHSTGKHRALASIIASTRKESCSPRQTAIHSTARAGKWEWRTLHNTTSKICEAKPERTKTREEVRERDSERPLRMSLNKASDNQTK